MRTLTEILQDNGFRRVAYSSATLKQSHGTVKTARWTREIEGRSATVQVHQVDDGEEKGTLQPGSRRACAGIVTAEDLESALAFHLFEVEIK